MLRRSLIALGASVLGLGIMVGAEILLAMRREYLPTEPALELDGAFGSPDGQRVTLAVLGDSTAAGVGAGAPEDAYPRLLAERLARDGHRVELHVFGFSGARVQHVLEDQVPRAEQVDPDLVFVGIGANDAIHLTPLGDVRRDMGRVLGRLLATGAEVVVAGAPDMRAAAFLEPLRSLAGWQGRRVEATIAGAARERAVPVVPLYEVGRFFAADPEAHNSADEFHPGPGGYRRWADAIYPFLTRAAQRIEG